MLHLKVLTESGSKESLLVFLSKKANYDTDNTYIGEQNIKREGLK